MVNGKIPFVYMLKVLILVLTLILVAVHPAYAIVDPLSVPNNRFGIHIIDETDIPDAAKLVNSNGGQWGYVTLVIQDNDRDIPKWQRIFDKLREAHLIPLIRLSTHAEGPVWKKPTEDEALAWSNFLSSLNWVVKNRYVIVFNEPNHSQEWGGSINAAEYAKVYRAFHDALKAKSSDYYILPAGLDAAAPNSPVTQEIGRYMNQMKQADPSIFSLFDGWNSHSYPNPAFQGSPEASGKGTVRSWQWELDIAHSLGLRTVPVFITETGWVHYEGKEPKTTGISSEVVGKFYQKAYQTAWNNPKVAAVTPFVLSYQDKPFDNFSFKKIGGEGFYPQFSAIQELDKPRGIPEQYHNSEVTESNIPSVLIANSHYTFGITYKNTGQSVWSAEDDYSLSVNNVLFSIHESVKPGNQSKIPFKLDTGNDNLVINVNLVHSNQKFGQAFENSIRIIAPPKITLNPTVIFNDSTGLELTFLDRGRVIGTIKDFTNVGTALEANLSDLVPGYEYEVRLAKEGFTTSKTKLVIKEGENNVHFTPLFPKPPNPLKPLFNLFRS
jgi:hypothetical protein